MTTESIFFHIHKPDMMPVGIKYEHIQQLDNYADGSIASIVLQDMLDYISYENIIHMIELCYKKLGPEGLISIQGIDIHKIASAITFHEIEHDVAKKILYNNNKRSIHSRNDICNILKSCGFILETQQYINIFEYYIEAKKYA